MILPREFYERDTVTVAKELLGKTLVHETPEGTASGRIVETEAYKGPEDRASHAYDNRRTKRTAVQFGPKGHAYVYQIHGKYFCFDVTSGSVPGKPEAVLVRAIEPVTGVELMAERRGLEGAPAPGLTNGPGKVCMALGITKRQNSADVCTSPLHIDTGIDVDESEITQATRINVDYAGRWRECPWRFLIGTSEYVSRKA
jgi:DNA-3-methyladenine glycosylase